MTANDHKSNLGERVTASGHSDLPGGQGTRTLNDVTGSSQKTATGHTESDHGKTGIDPRIDTGLPAIESAHVESGSGQKTATAREATAAEHGSEEEESGKGPDTRSAIPAPPKHRPPRLPSLPMNR